MFVETQYQRHLFQRQSSRSIRVKHFKVLLQNFDGFQAEFSLSKQLEHDKVAQGQQVEFRSTEWACQGISFHGGHMT
jgi:hypothetical protein